MSSTNNVSKGNFVQNHPKVVVAGKVGVALTTAALAAVAITAFLHIGTFAQHAQLAQYMGIGAAAGGGVLTIGLVSFIIYSCKRQPAKEEQPAEERQPAKEEQPAEERQPAKEEQPAAKEEKPPIDTYSGKVYSPKILVEKKLAKQLTFAVNAGNTVKKYADHAQFKPNSIDTIRGIEKKIQECIDNEVKLENVGAAETKGHIRKKMEDAHVACSLTLGGKQAFLYGVFDGHGDVGEVAKYVRDRLPGKLEEKLREGVDLTDEAITNAITEACIELEMETQEIKGGTTATFVLQVEGRIYTANVGDSRTVLMRKNDRPYQLSEDAEPNNTRFVHGVKKMGYEVTPVYENGRTVDRVDERFALARDIGENILSPRPKISRIDLHGEINPEQGKVSYSKGDYLVIACDGLWDVATNRDIYNAIWEMEERDMDVKTMAGRLVKSAIANRSGDNVTVLVVRL